MIQTYCRGFLGVASSEAKLVEIIGICIGVISKIKGIRRAVLGIEMGFAEEANGSFIAGKGKLVSFSKVFALSLLKTLVTFLKLWIEEAFKENKAIFRSYREEEFAFLFHRCRLFFSSLTSIFLGLWVHEQT